MKRFAKVTTIVGLVLAAAACSKVPAGYVGVRVDMMGTDKGVAVEPLGVGWHSSIKPSVEVFTFPTFTQNLVWEGKDQIRFQSNEGLNVAADIGLAYRVDGAKAVEVFQKFRRGIDEITNVFVRNIIRDALVREASLVKSDALYGAGKATLMDNVQKRVQDELEGTGIIIERVYWAGELALPPEILQRISNQIGATQLTLQRTQELEQVKAEADIVRARAAGEADAIRAKAQAEADAIRIKGEQMSRYPEVVEFNAVERWDGKLPQYQGSGAVPFINLKGN